MKEVKAKYRVAKQSNEDQAFWQQHIAAHAASGVSKTTYCYINQVDYARFLYWSRKKLLAKAADSLVAVKLKPVAENSLVTMTGVLCTLTLKSGDCLHVHNERVLSLILDRII